MTSEIERYEWMDGCIYNVGFGEYVKYDDHAKIVAELERDLEILRVMKDAAYGLGYNDGFNKGHDDGYNKGLDDGEASAHNFFTRYK